MTLRKLVATAGALASATAAQADAPAASSSAFLYSYQVLDTAKFEQGYRDHLGWHAAQRDHLTWYGWQVVSGPRAGYFVDGTFGSSFADVDRRPAPGADGAHFAQHVGPFVRPDRFEVLALWPEASTARSLEERKPDALTDVYTIEVSPSNASRFESALLALRNGAAQSARITWYRGLAGTPQATYLLMIGRPNWAALDTRNAPFDAWLASLYGTASKGDPQILSLVTSVRSEVWSYRKDLTYFPAREPGKGGD